MKTSRIHTNSGVIEYFYSRGSSVPIVFLSGIGGSLYEWHDMIKSGYTTLAYNRAGYGLSERGEKERTIGEASEELYSLLQQLLFQEKVILAGHSYGGLVAQHFAMHYSHLIEGVILIDSTSMNVSRINEVETSDETTTDEYWIRKCDRFSKLSEDELANELQPELPAKFTEWDSKIQEALLRHEISPRLYSAVGNEVFHMMSGASTLIKTNFPQVPLIVIGRDKEYATMQQIRAGIPEHEARGFEEIWDELIREQTRLSRHSTYIKATNSGHNIPYDSPKVIMRAIEQIVQNR